MAELSSGSDGQQRFTRRVFARRVGGAMLAAPFLSLLDEVARGLEDGLQACE